MNTNNNEIICAEVCAVLQNISPNEYNKVPQKITNFFNQYSKYAKMIKIDLNKPFEEQDISKDAKDIIFLIGFNYWITDEERKETVNALKNNEKEYDEKFDLDKRFKNLQENTNINNQNTELNNDQKENNKNNSLVIRKEKWYTKFLNKIKKIFKRKSNKT